MQHHGLKWNYVKDCQAVSFSNEDKLLGFSGWLDLLLIPTTLLSWIRSCSDLYYFLITSNPVFFWFSLHCGNTVESTGMSFVRSVHWKHNSWGFSAPLPRAFCLSFFVSYLKWDQFSTELMMTLRREMLLYEVMRGLPNAYLDCTNAQRAVQSGSLPVAYRRCSCLEAGAVGVWPSPSPGAHPRWHQCLCLRGGASASSCAAALTLSPPCLGSRSSWEAASSCFTTQLLAVRSDCSRHVRRERRARCEDYLYLGGASISLKTC